MTIAKKQIREIVEGLNITIHLDPHSAFASIYEACKQHIPELSYKTFSEWLELGSANANLLASGKREMTSKMAERIAESVGLTGDQKKYFVTLASYFRERNATAKNEMYETLMRLRSKQLPSDLFRSQLEFFQNWYNAAIVELLALPHAKDDVAWIMSCLQPKVTASEVKNSLKLLERCGYVTRDPERNNRLVPTKQVYSTGDEVQGMAFYRFHQQMIDLAKLALDEVQHDQREISAITVTCSPEIRQQMKEKIVALRKEPK